MQTQPGHANPARRSIEGVGVKSDNSILPKSPRAMNAGSSVKFGLFADRFAKSVAKSSKTDAMQIS